MLVKIYQATVKYQGGGRKIDIGWDNFLVVFLRLSKQASQYIGRADTNYLPGE